MKAGKHQTQPASRRGSAPKLRIIGGQWRGRKLDFPEVEGLRPTGDRIRETLFNWLAPHLPGARCLDLYAGSGALGLEALSRGAEQTLLLEKDRRAADQLRANLQQLDCPRGQVAQRDCLEFLKTGAKAEDRFDVVFVDPPFALNLWQASIDALESGGWLSAGAAVYIESGPGMEFNLPEHWQLHRDKTGGQVRYRLYWAGEPEN